MLQKNRFFRIAPTPSGFIHSGNAFNFRLTAQRCAHAGGTLRLRIDDLDRQRTRPEYLQNIFDTLRQLEISWPLGPQTAAEQEALFSQTLRLPRYHALLQQLASQNLVFACRCSRAQIAAESKKGPYSGTCMHRNIPLDAPEVSWRVRMPENAESWFYDETGKRVSTNLFALNPYFVVRRRDGLPAYHIASLADDVDYGITDIVRGEDLRESTFSQIWLAALLGLEDFRNIRFEHHPLLLDAQGQKLSKSAGAKALLSGRDTNG